MNSRATQPHAQGRQRSAPDEDAVGHQRLAGDGLLSQDPGLLHHAHRSKPGGAALRVRVHGRVERRCQGAVTLTQPPLPNWAWLLLYGLVAISCSASGICAAGPQAVACCARGRPSAARCPPFSLQPASPRQPHSSLAHKLGVMALPAKAASIACSAPAELAAEGSSSAGTSAGGTERVKVQLLTFGSSGVSARAAHELLPTSAGWATAPAAMAAARAASSSRRAAIGGRRGAWRKSESRVDGRRRAG